jgi:hypothetical protein
MSGIWVIFEGPDGAGKSSLADRTARYLSDTQGPTVLQHLTSHSAFGDYYGPPRLWTGGGLNLVQDRCAISDLVYAPVLASRASRFGEGRVREQLKTLVYRAIVVWVTADEETLVKRLQDRGDDLITEDMLNLILENYWREMGWWRDHGATMHMIDTTDGFPSDLELQLSLSVGWEQLALEIGG